MKIGITGAGGFIGSNLLHRLLMMPVHEVVEVPKGILGNELSRILAGIEVLFHIAGVNRPDDEAEFVLGNTEYTREILNRLVENDDGTKVVFTSSSQAELENPYGKSKREAESIIRDYVEKTGAGGTIYRLPNMFGKWSRPYYNSVVSTFCHNAAKGLELSVNEPEKIITLAYIDDVIDSFLSDIDKEPGLVEKSVTPLYDITLENLSSLIESFPELRASHRIPDLRDPLIKKLYSVYLTYLEPETLPIALLRRTDNRGSLVELIKSDGFGQIFYSTTKPGITRGNHFHNLKIERFYVITGKCRIRLRHIRTGELREYDVASEEDRYLEIPPGYTHSVTNTGMTELVMLFWANEIFDAENPDTYYKEVDG